MTLPFRGRDRVLMCSAYVLFSSSYFLVLWYNHVLALSFPRSSLLFIRCGSIVQAWAMHKMRNSTTMRTQYTIPAQKRMVLGKKVKHLRLQGLLPATVYGRGIEPVSIQLDSKAFNVMFR
ncbi:MAG: hypothetical protein EOM24_21860, partial [Chloroflexia bacterium]|nr:hypothetical protein [Chloroflexia bacterium]